MATDPPDTPVGFLAGLDRSTVKTGFDRVERLLAALDEPHESFDAIQIGGTNGKGSVARTVASGLQHHGDRVGLYTSPHMTDLGERVRVDGEPMRHRAMERFVDAVRPTVEVLRDEGDPPTFFEVTTAMAFWQFARRDIDVAVLEVGLGGRFDTTSVCRADVAAVTSVGLEHTGVLGDTVDDIAWEIGHVAPESGRLVTGATAPALEVLDGMATERGAAVDAVDREITVERIGRDRTEQRLAVTIDGRAVDDLRTPLLGPHQARNVAVAVGVLAARGVGDDAIRRGTRRVDPRGRFELVGRDPDVVLDAAHNPAAAEALGATIGERYGDGSVRCVLGVLADKDLEGIAERLAPHLDAVHGVAPERDRAAPADDVTAAVEGRVTETASHSSVEAGLDAALATATDDEAVVVTGSLYTVAEARRRWTSPGVDKHFHDPTTADDWLTATGQSGDGLELVHRTVTVADLSEAERERLLAAAETVGVAVASGPGTRDELDRSVTVSGSVAAVERLADALPRRLADRIRDGAGAAGTTVMGILNVTPDSFYDGGRYDDRDDAVERAEAMVAAGADVVDVGGESTRPGADPVPVDEERKRVVPVIESIAGRDLDASISVDTRNPATAAAALDAGADVVNDVTGLADPAMRRLVADRDCDVVVMDAVDVPVDPDAEPEYDDVVSDVIDRLAGRTLAARRAGVDREQITVDPGIGFGKGADGDAAVLRRIHEFRALGYPVLVGASRKSFLGPLTGLEDAEDRLEASVAAAVHAAVNGASVVRVHDVAPTVRALQVAEALADDDGGDAHRHS